MGMLTYFFSDMRRSDKKVLVKSMEYDRSDKEIESWLRCLTILRNKCAHYSRLYYAVFTSVPLFDEGLDSAIARTLYPQLLMLKQLVQSDEAWMKFAESFSALVSEYEDAIELKHMGLPEDWKTRLYKCVFKANHNTIVMITLYVVWKMDNQTNTLSIFAKNNKTL